VRIGHNNCLSERFLQLQILVVVVLVVVVVVVVVVVKQERNSNQARALLEQSNMGKDRPTDQPTNGRSIEALART
jgi:sensor domain CHASE-containing protein